MKNFFKYYVLSSSLFVGILYIFVGIIIFIGRERLYYDIVSILVFVFLIISLFNFFKYLTKYNDNYYLVSCIINLVVSFILVFVPNISYSIMPFLFSLYLFIISISNLIMYILFWVNKSNHKFRYLINFIIYLIVAFPIMINPLYNGYRFIICISIYLILLGIFCFIDFIVDIMPIRTKNSFKRKIRITLPKIIEVLIPYSVMRDINKSLEVNRDYDYFVGDDYKSDIDIIIHTSSNGVNRVGHLDIYYKGMVYSYGNYDEGSRKYKELFGDGVLFTCSDINKYINFCIDNSKKTIFVFGIKLSCDKDKMVSDKINEIMSNTYVWNYFDDKKYNNGNSYASKLYKKTRAKFYKFYSGKYKIYFVLGSNCSYLVDDILGNSGMDILSLNGIITPGTYYNYFNKEINRKNSCVISKNIYNSKRRPKVK